MDILHVRRHAGGQPLRRKQRPLCTVRGYCGPFNDERRYSNESSSGDTGVAICLHCGKTVSIAAELAKWEGSLWQSEFGANFDAGSGKA